MKKYFIFIIFVLFFKPLISSELYYLKKEGKMERKKLLSMNLHLISETRNGFFFIKDEMEKIEGFKIKRIGKLSENLYFITPRYDGIDVNNCGEVLFKEENLFLLEMDKNSPCFKSNDLWIHKMKFEKLSPSRSFEKIEIQENIFVNDMLENFSDEFALENFSDLVNYSESRYSTNQGCFSSVERAYDIFQDLGLKAEYQNYSYTFAPNVIGILEGLIEPEKVVILIGHIDDVPKQPPAPGANDNGSGSAMVLNLASILSNYRFSYTIKFILVTGEEQGLVGSSYYSSKAQKNEEDIIAVLNADMIGWEGDGKPQEEDLDISYEDNSENLAGLFMDVYNLYERMVPPNLIYCPSNYYSDHYPFWERGYPAIMGITDNEGICFQRGTYPYYHTHQDTIENCGDLEFFIKSLRSYLAVSAYISKPLCKVIKEKTYNFTNFDTRYICPAKLK